MTDFDGNKELIESFISEKGYGCDHNYWHGRNMGEKGESPVLYVTEKGDGIFALFYADDNDYEQLSGVLAPEERRKDVIYEFAEKVFDKGAKKFFINTSPELRADMQGDKKFIVSKVLRSFESPVFDLNDLDLSLSGKDWKKVRNHINSLVKNHSIRVEDCRVVDKEKLFQVVDEWAKSRKSLVSKSWKPYFMNFVKNGFQGCDVTRCVIVDGELCSVSAGWKIPNSDIYYSSIGIHNYRYNGLGEFAYIDELKELKNKGYSLVDLGGSEQRFFDFKRKFNPEYSYKSLFYWIKRK